MNPRLSAALGKLNSAWGEDRVTQLLEEMGDKAAELAAHGLKGKIWVEVMVHQGKVTTTFCNGLELPKPQKVLDTVSLKANN